MANDKKQLRGVIASAEHQRTNDKGWANWDIVLQDGTALRGVAVGPDGPKSFSPGQKLVVSEGRYTEVAKNYGWLYTKIEDEDGGSDEPKPKSSGKSYSGKSDYQQSKDEFNAYQIEKRDPKIERQTYIRMAIDVYIAGLAVLKNKPQNTDELDAYIDDAVAKGEAMYERMHTK